MLLATVTFTFLGNYIFTAVAVVHLINKEAVRPNPRPVLTFFLLFLLSFFLLFLLSFFLISF